MIDNKSQKEKTEVYCLVNLINGKIYIRSSITLAVRMKNSLNTIFFNKKNAYYICIIEI